MAMTVTSQSVLARPVLGRWTAPSRAPMTRVAFGFVPRVQKRSGLLVSCVSEDKENVAVPQPNEAKPTPTPTTTPYSPPPKPKVSTSFRDVLAFSGPAPERINGRLAMIGFVAAMGVELSRGTDLVAQISDGGLQWFVFTSLLLSAASLIPMLSGVTVESKSKGLMTSDAEMWNGRFAMLGLVALAFTEFVKGGALV